MKTLQRSKKVKIIDNPSAVSEKTKYILKQIFVLLLSFVFASYNNFFGMAPFGIAFCSSVKKKYLIVSVVGSCIGYAVFQEGIFALRYIACILCVAIILSSLNRIIKFENVKLIFPIVSASCTMITGVVITIANKEPLFSLLSVLCESIIAGTASFFISRALRIKNITKGAKVLNRTDIMYLSVFAFVFLLSFSTIKILDFSPAKAFACFIIMLFAIFKGERYGAFLGILVGIALGINDGASVTVAVFAVSGLICGFFSPLRQIGVSLSFAFSSLISLILLSSIRPGITTVLEVCIPSIVFMLIPRKLMFKIKAFLFSSDSEPTSNSESLRQNIVTRLGLASAAIDEVSKGVEKISASMHLPQNPNMNNIYDRVQKYVCSSCNLRSFCWITNINDTMNIFNDIGFSMNTDNELETSDLPAYFAGRCLHKDKLVNEFNSAYKYEISKITDRENIGDSKGILSEQFSCVSDILKDLSREFDKSYMFDNVTAEKLNYYLQQKGLPVKNVSCVLDEFDHMTVEIICQKHHKPISKSDLKNSISKLCDREFADADAFEISNNLVIRYSEKAIYNVSIGSHQHPFNNDSVCGDCCECFSDSKGRQIIVLSDGMGTGKSAAIDGTIASKTLATLVKSGFSFETALKIVNSALLTKVPDESLATLDIACIDSFTGKVEFYKAGAAPSAVKKGKNVALVERPSLPAGILSQVEFSRFHTRLSEGDIILVMSDGVFGDDNNWIKELLYENSDKSAEDIAHIIADEAVKQKNQNDDVTVIAAILN